MVTELIKRVNALLINRDAHIGKITKLARWPIYAYFALFGIVKSICCNSIEWILMAIVS